MGTRKFQEKIRKTKKDGGYKAMMLKNVAKQNKWSCQQSLCWGFVMPRNVLNSYSIVDKAEVGCL